MAPFLLRFEGISIFTDAMKEASKNKFDVTKQIKVGDSLAWKSRHLHSN